jgi:hypothetical protein
MKSEGDIQNEGSPSKEKDHIKKSEAPQKPKVSELTQEEKDLLMVHVRQAMDITKELIGGTGGGDEMRPYRIAKNPVRDLLYSGSNRKQLNQNLRIIQDSDSDGERDTNTSYKRKERNIAFEMRPK